MRCRTGYVQLAAKVAMEELGQKIIGDWTRRGVKPRRSAGAPDPFESLLLRSCSNCHQTPGGGPLYSSLIRMDVNGKGQLVGYDATSLCGWDFATGKKLWQLTPPRPGDFNVPTPVALGSRLLASSENSGTRLYQSDRE